MPFNRMLTTAAIAVFLMSLASTGFTADSGEVAKPPMKLALAIGVNDLEGVNAAITAGANVNYQHPDDGLSILMIAVMQTLETPEEKDANLKIIKSLIGAGADLAQKTHAGQTALDLAKLHNNAEAIGVLNATTAPAARPWYKRWIR